MILFLDIDGTLHPMNRQDGVLSCLPMLEDVLRQHPGVDIVISSAWRTDHSLAQLRALFSPDISPRVIGITPDRRAQYGVEKHQRQLEVEDWLSEQGREHEPWVAVDDDAWQFVPGCPRLIVVDGETGLPLDLAERLSARLSRSR